MKTNTIATLSFPTALFMTINTMLGAGIFINTLHLAQRAGVLSWFAYLLVGLLVFPLMYTIATITKHHPYGGFYYYAKPLGEFWGFLSAWTYAIAKLASATLLIHICSTIIHTEWELFSVCSVYTIDYILFFLFIITNSYGIRLGWLIILMFLTCKLTPALYVIINGLTHVTAWQLPATVPAAQQFFGITTNCLYAFLGFETVCSISMHLKDSARNTARVMIGAFITTVTITILYQATAFFMIHKNLASLETYLDVFPFIMHASMPSLPPQLSALLLRIIYSMIGLAALGGAYSIVFSNAWNIYTLAHHNHLFPHTLFTYKNQHNSPIFCIIAQMCICFCFLQLTHGNGLILQNIGVTGCVITFLLTILANYQPHEPHKNPILWRVLTGTATVSSVILLSSSLYNIMHMPTLLPLYIMGFILASGTILYSIVQYTTPGQSN